MSIGFQCDPAKNAVSKPLNRIGSKFGVDGDAEQKERAIERLAARTPPDSTDGHRTVVGRWGGTEALA